MTNIPTFIRQPYTDSGGYLTPQMQLYHEQLNNQLQLNISEDGLVVPSRSAQEIAAIASPDNPNGRPNGTLWYDTDSKTLKFKQNGVVKTVATT